MSKFTGSLLPTASAKLAEAELPFSCLPDKQAKRTYGYLVAMAFLRLLISETRSMFWKSILSIEFL